MGISADFVVGTSSSLTRTVTAETVEAFASLSGDTNPVHLDAAYAADTRFKKRIAHGMIAASYVSALLGSQFPGPGTIYVSQSLTFMRPVFLGDTLTVTARVSDFRPETSLLTLETTVTNQAGKTVLAGEAVCLVSDVRAPLELTPGAPAAPAA